MTAAPQSCQPEAAELRQVILAKAQYFVDCKYILRADERQKSMGLAYVEAERQDLAGEIASFAMGHASALQARVDDRDRTIDLLEANARVQAKLLADTGRLAEDLTKALEPFANIALLHDFDPAAGDMIDMPDFAITPNDIRIARSALSLERSGGAT